MEKPKPLLIMFLAITIVVAGFIYYSYSKKSGTLMNRGEQLQEGGQQQDANFQGPTGGPYIKGPGGPPPVSE